MIKISGLTKLYKNKRGIRDISLTVKTGEILGLLGPNGSGKTTLMKAMLSLIREDSGRIEVDGKDLHENFESIIAKTGALIESPAIYKDLTAYQNLRLAARRPEDIEDIDRVLNIVHLERYKNDKAGRFSLGMKQRLGLAAALMGDPEIVILDEPVNGLDIEGVVEIREYIKTMNEKYNTTFVISSHIASEIEKLSTTTAVIYDGELVSIDSTQHIMSLYPSMEDYFLEKVHERRGSI
ncbi:MAG TPA: ATP-binding cassette domain-containing protein [Candidatus Ornithomonoglobus merdipullorum]|uniref:ATP-binding cassette domain-containing protein n=1 Tax=Candidatus Ornithomonoglobus merdipullorum TaxID=2840895 RepID=A0A9D1MD37_9FIRM|nr:ATP-binding cassette domain-containing protein [Candidatus Ornithomonoglobus merdipullorum]